MIVALALIGAWLCGVLTTLALCRAAAVPTPPADTPEQIDRLVRGA